ncbi:MAG: hypothetical protein CMI79_01740 [Candidatus Pelagibacter sp.]|nr:hypothetical protein [Candidatus Pelagibacter sp.]|tara:strand:+ start:713 stop:940 length:228 start_codon:yes stop_codon:yes gene_type:complete
MRQTAITMAIIMLIFMLLALSNMVLNRQEPETFQNMIDQFHINKNQLKRKVRSRLNDTHDYLYANVRSRMKQIGF